MTYPGPLPRAAAVALAVAALTGCGGADRPTRPPVADAAQSAAVPATPDGGSATPAAGRAVDPCALVSEQEAEQLAGTPLEEAVPVRESCTYPGPPTGPTAQVEIFVGDGAKKFLDIDRELGHDLQPLPGVGDEAYAEDFTVFVHASGVWVAIRLTRLDDAAAYRKPLAELARTVAGRL
ncbi:Protein of unknown function [Micromonospora pattaloongensis]|uniref:DUF3558 domain-containing protein n=2 Tax=Micromonospora pattaloongensis TaxID=405436 RepID=A0A1H3RWW1_9ACTN|nr:Protein of unknown function [Micromonospora pattaloongensis]